MPKYGAQFKKDSQFDDTINYKDTIGYDTMNYSDKWQTVTQSVHTNPGAAKATEFSTSFHMVDTELIASGKQDEYRERWYVYSKQASKQQAALHAPLPCVVRVYPSFQDD